MSDRQSAIGNQQLGHCKLHNGNCHLSIAYCLLPIDSLTQTPMQNNLSDRTEILVRFNEADPLGIVWHGHYIRYFEDGREAFGNKYGIGYLDFYREGLIVPIVNVQCDFKRSLRY